MHSIKLYAIQRPETAIYNHLHPQRPTFYKQMTTVSQIYYWWETSITNVKRMSKQEIIWVTAQVKSNHVE